MPHSVIVCRAGFEHAQRIQDLLLSNAIRMPHYRFQVMADWEKRYRTVRGWLAVDGVEESIEDGESVSLDEIGHVLLQYARSQAHPPRLALVLSGGGAKCSYQVGAVAAIETKLAQLRRDNPDCPLDIQ